MEKLTKLVNRFHKLSQVINLPEEVIHGDAPKNVVNLPEETIQGDVTLPETVVEGRKPSPFIPGTKPGQPGYQLPSASLVPQKAPVEQSVYTQPSAETVPGPNGTRIPAVDYVPEVGMASSKPFDWGHKSIEPAHLGKEVKLPQTGRDAEMEPWRLDADDGLDKKEAAFKLAVKVVKKYSSSRLSKLKNLR